VLTSGFARSRHSAQPLRNNYSHTDRKTDPIDPHPGFCSASDPLNLARSINRLVRDPDLLRRLGRSARLIVEARFDFDRMAAETEELYAEIVDSPRAMPEHARRASWIIIP